MLYKSFNTLRVDYGNITVKVVQLYTELQIQKIQSMFFMFF